MNQSKSLQSHGELTDAKTEQNHAYAKPSENEVIATSSFAPAHIFLEALGTTGAGAQSIVWSVQKDSSLPFLVVLVVCA